MTFVLDRKLFKGNAALVTDGSTAEEMLASVNANFTVGRVPAEYNGRQYPAHQLWIRQDNQDCLGCFGTRRIPQQPEVIGQFLIDFCGQSEKQVKPDVVGSINQGKTIYVACRMAGDSSNFHDTPGTTDGGGMSIRSTISQEDRTEHWLMLMVHYGESLATKAYVLSNELVCSNGMALRTNEKTLAIAHRALQDGRQVEAILNQAVRSSAAYARMKDRFMHQTISLNDGCNLIRQFHDDPDGQSKIVKNLERIYKYNLIGGDLPTRAIDYNGSEPTTNLWRLANAQTQYTSHNYVSKHDAGKSLLSQVEGSKARSNRNFMQFLESQFTTESTAALVMA